MPDTLEELTAKWNSGVRVPIYMERMIDLLLAKCEQRAGPVAWKFTRPGGYAVVLTDSASEIATFKSFKEWIGEPLYAASADAGRCEWISVKDRLPDKEDVYLCAQFYKAVGWDLNTVTFGNGRFVENNVTHWMPLPDPPAALAAAETEKK